VQVAQRLLALAAGIWFNWQLGVADKPSMVAYDHSPPANPHQSSSVLSC